MSNRTYLLRVVAPWVLAFATACKEEDPTEPADPAPTELSLQWQFETGTHFPLSIAPDATGRPVLYVAQKTGGVLVLGLDSSPPTSLANIPTTNLLGLDAMYAVQNGSHLFVALGDFFAAAGSRAGLAMLDVANPSSPAVVGTWATDGIVNGSAVVLVKDDIVYLGAMREGVFVLDVSNPSQIERIAVYLPDPNFPVPNPSAVQHPNARGLALDGDRLYVANDAGGLRVLDVSDPRAPVEIGRYLNQSAIHKQQAYNSVVLDGTRAFLAVDYCGFEVVDVSDPGAIVRLGWWNPWSCESPSNIWFNSPGHTNQIAFDPVEGIAWLSAGDSELLGVDVSISSAPRLVQSYGARDDGFGAWGVACSRGSGGPGAKTIYLSYVRAVIPFRGSWAGVKAFR